MPISGLVKSSSSRPAARSRAGGGARGGPWVRPLLRGFNELSDTSESLPKNFPGHQNKRGHHPPVDDGPEKRFGCCCLPAITRLKNPQELALICNIGPSARHNCNDAAGSKAIAHGSTKDE